MEDFFFLCLGFAFCASPFVGIGFLITVLRKPEDREARERLDAAEQQLAWVRTEGTKLGQRLVALEAREKALEEQLARVAQMRVTGAAIVTEGVSAAHASPAREPSAAEAGAIAAATAGETQAVAAREVAASEVTSIATAVEARADAAVVGADVAAVAATATDGVASEVGSLAAVSAAEALAVAAVVSGVAMPAADAPVATAAVAAAAGAGAATASAATASAATASVANASVASASVASASVASASAASAGGVGAGGGGAGGPGAPPVASPRGDSTPPPSSDEGWERWIGVRGAAALGACVLVVAALYFFQYSVEHGWIGPFARVLIGLTTGMTCVLGSEPLRRRYAGTTSGGAPIAATLANWLAGAGIAILYASSWAASGLYHLVPSLVSGVAMVAITGACAGLAIYRDSLAIAVLGLFGGFLTPIALSTGEDRPIPLFTYLFLLDAALLFLAQKKRWPSLAALALGFTGLYQLAWIFGRMEEATTWIGLVVTLGFSVLFAGATMFLSQGDGDDEQESATNKLVRIAAVLTPFVLAIAFATQRGAIVGFGATLTLVCLLSAGAVLVGRRDRLGWLAPAAASATAGLLLVFLSSHHSDASVAWQSTLLAVLPALLYLVGVELSQREIFLSRDDRGISLASLIASGGATLLIAFFAITHVNDYLVWSFTLIALSVALARVAHVTRWPVVMTFASLVHGGTWAVWSLAWGAFGWTSLFGGEHRDPVRLAVVAVLGVLHLALYQGLAIFTAQDDDEPRPADATGTAAIVSGRTLLEIASAIGPAVLLLSLTAANELRDTHQALHIGLTWVLGLFVAMPAMRAASRKEPYIGLLALVASALVALVATTSELSLAPLRALETVRSIRFASSGIAVVLFTVLPTLSTRLARTRWAWRTAALTPLFFFGALHHGWVWAFGSAWIGALPVLLALLTLSLVGFARTRNDDDRDVRTSALVWLSGATMLFVTVAIPLQLDREWITIGWALEGVALLALYRRLDHAGLKWVATLLFVSVASRLLLNPYVLGYYERSPIRIFNWLSYTYLVPAACLVGAGLLLSELEGPRLRNWESTFLPDNVKRPFTAFFYALALVIGFAWLNLTIFDWYATGPSLSIPTDRLPARDLTISIAWALYGLFVLSLGMWRSSTPMRITSLLLILLTAAKVFLYDLSNLRDLYRVAALVGLAMSLIVISLAYQRFVFRSTPKERA